MSPQLAFGERLRSAREKGGVSLEAIAQGTKIGVSLLAALERGDCSRWPGGVYSRAYVRSYAQRVGLDPKAISDEFCECFPTVAWPDGPPGPVLAAGAVAPLDLTQYDLPEEPLRLTLDPMPSKRWQLMRSGVTKRLAECAVGILFAAVASLLGMDFWMALSAASLTVQARHLP